MAGPESAYRDFLLILVPSNIKTLQKKNCLEGNKLKG